MQPIVKCFKRNCDIWSNQGTILPMELVSALILGIVQGLTEFIPVSSSGHLILVGQMLNFRHSGLAFDTVLDVGTLAALYIFFARDFWAMGRDLVLGGPQRRLALILAVATVPAVVAGLLVADLAETVFRSSTLVAFNLIWVGIVMYLADRYCRQRYSLEGVTPVRGIGIGLAQCLALVPGTSRSGITITAGRLLGLDRVSATRFSFLLSAPVITGATLYALMKPETITGFSTAPEVYVVGILGAFVAGYAAIRFMIGYLSRHGLAPFAVYRVLLGVFILISGALS